MHDSLTVITEDSVGAKPGATRACDFSREHYEQGAFVHHVLASPRWRAHIRLVPWGVLQTAHVHPMVHHFIGPPRTKEKYLSEYVRYRGPGQGLGTEPAPAAE